MHGKLGVTSRTASGHIRFTSNVLRSLGIANDVLCLLIAYVLALIVYEISIGYYFDARLHRTGAVILGVNYLLIKVSRDGYTLFRGQGEDLGSTSIADFLLASGLTALVVLQLGMMPEFSRGLGLFFIGFGVVLLFLSQMAFRRLIWILMDRGYSRAACCHLRIRPGHCLQGQPTARHRASAPSEDYRLRRRPHRIEEIVDRFHPISGRIRRSA